MAERTIDLELLAQEMRKRGGVVAALGFHDFSANLALATLQGAAAQRSDGRLQQLRREFFFLAKQALGQKATVGIGEFERSRISFRSRQDC